MIRRQGDLGGEWDRMRLGENEAEDDLWRARDRTTFSRKKRAALKKKWRELARRPFGCPRLEKIFKTRKHRKESPVFESPERPKFQPENIDLHFDSKMCLLIRLENIMICKTSPVFEPKMMSFATWRVKNRLRNW